ncbi:MAG: TIGR04283 family arsenosugar biosynthesis glycosyltransferase [Anaerolineae bacterium]|nr:MAG: TIGR04283 family arsenosugar biosynthesis glycosyltransferase [Anaerolineae bacterium]
MPVLNEEKLIEQSLLVLAGWPGLELIVVDGGSVDRTVRLAARYARVITSPPGRAVQMNAGAREARGEIFWFVHVDTTLPPDAPDQVQAAVAEGFVGGAFSTRFDEPTPFWDLITWLDNHRTRIFHIYFGSRAIFVRADTFRELGGFPEIPFLEDVALSRKLRRAGRTVMLDAVALESFRRFRKNGPIRQLLLDMILLGAFGIGVSPWFLARLYKDVR